MNYCKSEVGIPGLPSALSCIDHRTMIFAKADWLREIETVGLEASASPGEIVAVLLVTGVGDGGEPYR
jgi:hypothetical protein